MGGTEFTTRHGGQRVRIFFGVCSPDWSDVAFNTPHGGGRRENAKTFGDLE